MNICFHRIINERISQIDLKLAEVKCEEASEYLQPLAELEDHMRVRSEVASILRDYRLKNIQIQSEAEEITAKQNFEVCKLFKQPTYKHISEPIKLRLARLREKILRFLKYGLFLFDHKIKL